MSVVVSLKLLRLVLNLLSKLGKKEIKKKKHG